MKILLPTRRSVTLLIVATLFLTAMIIHGFDPTPSGGATQAEQHSTMEFGTETHDGTTPINKPYYGVDEDMENENISLTEYLQRISDYGNTPLEQTTDLFLRKIPLDDVKLVEKLATLISSKKAKNVKRFVLNKNGIDKEHPNMVDTEMLGVLVENGFLKQSHEPTLEVIGVTSNNMTIEGCVFLSKLLFQKGSVVKKLYLYNNNIGADCLKVIFNPILQIASIPMDESKNSVPPLTKLVVLQNNIGNEGVRVVRRIAEAIPTITDIVLKSSGMEEDGLIELAQFIEKNPKRLTHIDISENKVGLRSFVELASALEKSELQLLDMNEIGMSSKEAVDSLAKLIKKNKSIRKIDMSDNRIGDSGVKIISKTLSEKVEGTDSFPYLSKIDMSNVGLTGEGIRSVIDAVKQNSGLKKVYIYRVDFFFEDATIETEMKQFKKIIKSDFIDEDQTTTSGVEQNDTAPPDEEGEASEEGEEGEEDNITEEELKAHPLFNSAFEGSKKKDEL